MLIISDKPGYLANLLFLFGNFIACARENNLSVMNPAFDDYAEYFQTTSKDFFCRYPARASLFRGNKRTRRLFFSFSYYVARLLVRSPVKSRFFRALAIDWEEEVQLDDPKFLELANHTSLLFLQGWLFRDHNHFAKHAAAIRAYFEPVEPFRHNVDELIKRARAGCDLLVGVHIRHGDYRKFLGGKYFYEIDEYVRVMEKVERMHAGKKVGFLICSNAEQTEADFARFNFTFGNNHLVEDMYSFAKCDLVLGPPSTYTTWAAFYGEVPLYMIEDINAEPRFDAPHTFLVAAK
jgi:hypothetical protein